MNEVLYAGGSRRHLSNEPKDESVETKWEHLQYYESRLEVSQSASASASGWIQRERAAFKMREFATNKRSFR